MIPCAGIQFFHQQWTPVRWKMTHGSMRLLGNKKILNDSIPTEKMDKWNSITRRPSHGCAITFLSTRKIGIRIPSLSHKLIYNIYNNVVNRSTGVKYFWLVLSWLTLEAKVTRLKTDLPRDRTKEMKTGQLQLVTLRRLDYIEKITWA